MRRAAIDIGSNSLLLAILGEGGRLLCDEVRVVGLGKGLGDGGRLRPDRRAAASAVLREYVALAEAHGVSASEIRAVATSGARRASDAASLFEEIERDLGLVVTIISGEEEARLTWLGAHVDLEVPEGPRLVVDLGAGSTEIVLGLPGAVSVSASLEVGSVRLTERFLCAGQPEPPDRFDPEGLVQMQQHIDTQIGALRLEPAPRTVIGVAATVTTLAAMSAGLPRYDREKIHGSWLERGELQRFMRELLSSDREQRRQIASISPERADYLLAGATILDRILGAVASPRLLVSDRGLRFGVLYDAP